MICGAVSGGVGRVDRAAEFILCEAPHLPPSAMNLLAKASQEPEWYVIVSLLCHSIPLHMVTDRESGGLTIF